MSTKNLLVELFVEELPPKALKALGESFGQSLFKSLKDSGLTSNDSTLTTFASPRRLGAHITNVARQSASTSTIIKLMPRKVGLTELGYRSEALIKRLIKEGYVIDDHTMMLDLTTDPITLKKMGSPVPLEVALQQAIGVAVQRMPIPKIMSYQINDGWETKHFVRPAHGLIALHGTDVVNVSVLGLKAGRTTQGHRFEATKSVVEIRDADSYAQQMKDEGAVIASFAARREEIVQQLQAAAHKEGLQPITDEALLDEVTALVERPNVLTCQFEKEFLDVPAECLILTMKANQKYFPLLDASGKLTNKFLVVSNIRPADPSRVIQGNERVVRPRLADAKFFFDEDRKHTLMSRLTKLSKVVYHNQLGSQLDRVERVRKLASVIGEQLGAGTANKADQAAQIAKADLVTDMVGEFPELQGIMGRYYALADGLEAEVAEAICEQYLPRGAGDELPATRAGMALALADKLETLCGIFAVGQKPTGTKDPFGLRRAAIGVLRILIERKQPLDLSALIQQSLLQQPLTAKPEVASEVYDYIMERLRGYYLDGSSSLNITTEMFDAVLANRPASPLDFDTRLRALHSFLNLSDAQALTAANKRINNLLKKAETTLSNAVSTDKFVEAAERTLYEQLLSAEQATAPLFAASNYQDALTRLAMLRPAVDQFFDSVMVMADDPAVRNNRLALLSRLRSVFLKVADLSCLPG